MSLRILIFGLKITLALFSGYWILISLAYILNGALIPFLGKEGAALIAQSIDFILSLPGLILINGVFRLNPSAYVLILRLSNAFFYIILGLLIDLYILERN
jgi:hypothetical protein